VSFLFVVNVLAFIPPIVRPGEQTESLHFVVFPITFVLAAVTPLVDAFALDVVFLELAIILALVRPCEAPDSVLLSLNVISFIGGSVRPGFKALAMLLIFLPVALVSGSV
jgi:hypothetical protein